MSERAIRRLQWILAIREPEEISGSPFQVFLSGLMTSKASDSVVSKAGGVA
jgi:hypothetical protein